MGSRARKYAESKGSDDRDTLTPFQKVQRWFDIASDEGYGGHDSSLHKLLKLESATFEPSPSHPHNSRTVFSLTIPPEFCNMAGNLHGGAVALIFDICTSTAIMVCSKDGFWDTGHVSRTLNCTYLKPAPEGSKVYIYSEVLHLGKKLCLTRGEIRNEDGKVCYSCEHGKAAVGSSSL